MSVTLWFVSLSAMIIDSLQVRRYQSEERMAHPAHFDTHALVTGVIALNSYGRDYHGGIYVSVGVDPNKEVNEQYLGLQAGDAVLSPTIQPISSLRSSSTNPISYMEFVSRMARGGVGLFGSKILNLVLMIHFIGLLLKLSLEWIQSHSISTPSVLL